MGFDILTIIEVRAWLAMGSFSRIGPPSAIETWRPIRDDPPLFITQDVERLYEPFVASPAI